MADRLVNLWEGESPSSILEFGCGTGILTRKFRQCFPRAFILATDAAPGMLEEAEKSLSEKLPSLEFAEQDAEGLAEASREVSARAPFDVIASNALVQWFPDLENHFRFAAGLARSGGAYLLSGFERSNFPELNEILSRPPFSYRSFPGHDSHELTSIAAKTRWKQVALETWEEREIQPSGRDVLRRLQFLGSTRDPREGGRLNRNNLEYLISEYKRLFSDENGVRLTWKPWVALLRRG